MIARRPGPDLDSQGCANRNSWDCRDWEDQLGNVSELAYVVDHMVADIGEAVLADAFWCLFKANPVLHTPEEMRPDRVMVLTVVTALTETIEFRKIRATAIGDVALAVLGVLALVPLVNKILDEYSLAQEKLRKLQQQIDELIEAMASEDPDPEAIAALEEAIDEAAGEIEPDLDSVPISVLSIATEYLEAATGTGERLQRARGLWGMSPGEWQRIPADRRLALAKRISTEAMRRILSLFGASLDSLADARMRRSPDARDEIIGVTEGGDINRVLSSDLARLHDARAPLFYADYVSDRLRVWDMDGMEPKAKGAVIWLQDGSGSMSGPRSDWASAIGLVLLDHCRTEQRRFHGIHFASAEEIEVFEFIEPADFSPERILDFAEHFFCGGTDFATPLDAALELLREEHATTGRVSGDIVLCTDGEHTVDPTWLADFKAEQKRLAFKTWGILIDEYHDETPSGSLPDITDGRVSTVRELVNGKDITAVLGGI